MGFSRVEVVIRMVGLRFPGWMRETVILEREASRVYIGSDVEALKVMISRPTVRSSLFTRYDGSKTHLGQTNQLSSRTYVSATPSDAVCPLAMSHRSRSCSGLESVDFSSAVSADRNGDSLTFAAFIFSFSALMYAELGRSFGCCRYEGGR